MCTGVYWCTGAWLPASCPAQLPSPASRSPRSLQKPPEAFRSQRSTGPESKLLYGRRSCQARGHIERSRTAACFLRYCAAVRIEQSRTAACFLRYCTAVRIERSRTARIAPLDLFTKHLTVLCSIWTSSCLVFILFTILTLVLALALALVLVLVLVYMY